MLWVNVLAHLGMLACAILYGTKSWLAQRAAFDENTPFYDSWPRLVMDELIGVTCLKLRACYLDRNNSSIHLFTKCGQESLQESVLKKWEKSRKR